MGRVRRGRKGERGLCKRGEKKRVGVIVISVVAVIGMVTRETGRGVVRGNSCRCAMENSTGIMPCFLSLPPSVCVCVFVGLSVCLSLRLLLDACTHS